jgi:hypothetical protein
MWKWRRECVNFSRCQEHFSGEKTFAEKQIPHQLKQQPNYKCRIPHWCLLLVLLALNRILTRISPNVNNRRVNCQMPVASCFSVLGGGCFFPARISQFHHLRLSGSSVMSLLRGHLVAGCSHFMFHPMLVTQGTSLS